MTALARSVASVGGVGFLRPAPGTWGSLVALPAVLLGPWGCLALGVAVAVVGFWAVASLPEARGDPGWVVVDETAGQCLALACIPAGAGFWWMLLAFALFRVLDIAKPGPVGWADRQEGPVGVMLDDLIAGALAGAVVATCVAAWPA